jgi:hypothetical protein
MRYLSIPFVPLDKCATADLPLHAIGEHLWSKTFEKPPCQAAFRISHYDFGLCVKFYVTEPFLKVKKREPNGPVHKDNCVEFFFRFDNDSNYYNFEFNCLGCVKAAYGGNRADRKCLPVAAIKTIEDNISIEMDNISEERFFRWEIAVILPLSVFHFHKVSCLVGSMSTGNFAKCGDDLPLPHFLSWVDIPTADPDFHQPAFFGNLQFT